MQGCAMIIMPHAAAHPMPPADQLTVPQRRIVDGVAQSAHEDLEGRLLLNPRGAASCLSARRAELGCVLGAGQLASHRLASTCCMHAATRYRCADLTWLGPCGDGVLLPLAFRSLGVAESCVRRC